MVAKPTETQLKELANKDATVDTNYVIVLYGDYGSRKTTTACSMVNERGLLLSSDDSWKVLKNPRHKDIFEKINVRHLDGLSQLNYIDFDGYDTIIWDTISQSVDVYLDLLYDEATWGKGSNGQFKYRETITSDHPDLKDLQALAPADYRVTRDSFRPVLNKLFRETNAHIIFTSQVTEPIKGLSSNEQKRPSIPQATFKIIGTRADVIANTRMLGNKFVIDTTHNLTQLGKSRIEGIQGQMDLDSFVSKYKEIAF